MRLNVVRVMMAQKDYVEQSWRSGLQLFAEPDNNPEDEPDDDPEDEPDDDPEDKPGRKEKKYSPKRSESRLLLLQLFFELF